MTIAMGGKRKKKTALSSLNQALRRPDLSILGDAVKSLPPAQWRNRMFFMGVPDTDLRRHTDGGFPATLRPDKDTHPLFVLSARTTGPLVCPCTSRRGSKRSRYIQKGCRLEMKGHVMDRDSYLVERYSFTLPLDGRFSRKLLFMGLVPDTCLRDGGS